MSDKSTVEEMVSYTEKRMRQTVNPIAVGQILTEEIRQDILTASNEVFREAFDRFGDSFLELRKQYTVKVLQDEFDLTKMNIELVERGTPADV